MLKSKFTRIFRVEETLLSFVFLLVLVMNAIIIGDLFLSFLQSPFTLIFIRVVIMLAILGFLAANGSRHPEIRGRGWAFLLVGFTLVFLDSLIELLPGLPFFERRFLYLNSSVVFLLSTLFLELFGYFCLAYGFFLWIPAILEARRKIEKTAVELERMVAERTWRLQESNEQLIRSKLKLEEAGKLKTQFLASISHELKTPLNSIMGFCRLLNEERQGPLTPRQKKSIAIIDSNSKALYEQINKILEFARLESEKVRLKVESLALGELLQEAAAIIEPLAREKKLEVGTRVDKSLEVVYTDRKIFKQLLLGILDNAVKFTDSGWVRVTSGQDTVLSSWWIAISDSGIGISQADLPFIFDEFRQEDGSLRKRYGGTGLGLSIARKLARLLNGEITVESTPGKGSTFTITFPMSPEQIARQLTDSLSGETTGDTGGKPDRKQ
ncbi:MAG: HAMP domain-containing histidine kinase [Candidatus Glassbacteria bacterium]|nr:HAMP domain-containing histidine kinase [Candidatus Glassbacteria bacterium]